jgi:hypothetical protein
LEMIERGTTSHRHVHVERDNGPDITIFVIW